MDWLIRVLGAARIVKDAVGHQTSAEETQSEWTVSGSNQSRSSASPDSEKAEQKKDPPVIISPNVAEEAIEKTQTNSTTKPIQRKHRFPPRKLDRDAVDVVRRLRRHDYAGYLVGGCVRDLYLSLSPKDFDVSTSARPEEIKKVFRNSRIIGRRFRLAHIYFRGGKIIETATFRGNAGPINIDTDASEDLLITRDNVWGTEKEDALRRDFTINGLMYDISTSQIIDYVGGLEDLDAKRIRTIGDPNIRLQEDPVRILRAIRFSAKLDFELDHDLKLAIQRYGKEIGRCATARVLEETFKLFRSGNSSKSVTLLTSTQILHTVLPQLVPHLCGTTDKATSRAEDIFGYLHALDKLIGTKGQVSDAVILTAILMVPIQLALDELEPRLHGQNLNSIILDLTKDMMLTRRMRERARQLLLAQKHLRKPEPGKRPKRRVSAKAMVKRSYFADALDLFEIWSTRHKREFEQVQIWRERAGEWEAQTPSKEENNTHPTGKPAPRNRRRRGGRGNGKHRVSRGPAPKGKRD